MRLFTAFCALVVLGYGTAALRGITPFPRSTHVNVPSSVRSASGGYRVYRHWGGGGFHGGK